MRFPDPSANSTTFLIRWNAFNKAGKIIGSGKSDNKSPTDLTYLVRALFPDTDCITLDITFQ